MMHLNDMRSSAFSKKHFIKIMTYVLTHLYSHIVYKSKQQLPPKPLKNLWRGSFTRWTFGCIYIKKLFQAEQRYMNMEREPLVMVFVVTRLKQFFFERQFTLQTHQKQRKYFFAPDEVIRRTSSTRITRKAITLMVPNLR